MKNKQLLLNTIVITAIAFSLTIIYGHQLYRHIFRAIDPYTFSDDARIYIPSISKLSSHQLSQNDYVANYILKVIIPFGYSETYRFFTFLETPEVVSKFLPYVLWVLVLIAMGISSWKIGMGSTCWATLAFTIGPQLFFDRMMGGVPRSFGFPLTALSIYFIVSGRVSYLALTTVLSAFFYPAAGVCIGISLAVLSVLGPNLRGDLSLWSLKRRIILLFLVGINSCLLVFPQFLNSNLYGERVTPSNILEFPEAGPGGRYGGSDRPPFPGYIQSAKKIINSVFVARSMQFYSNAKTLREVKANTKDKQKIFQYITLISILTILIFLIKNQISNKVIYIRVLIFLLASIFCYQLSIFVFPYFYLPQRYILYSLPLVLILLIPASFYELSRVFLKSRMLQQTLVFAISGTVLFVFGGLFDPTAGYMSIKKDARGLYRFLEGVSAESTVAGWPKGAINNVEYLSKKPVLLTYETHQAFNRDYIIEMRARMNALVSALYATDLLPIKLLRDNFSVRYLIVEDRFYQGSAPKYFEPFNAMILDQFEKAKGNFIVNELKSHAVFSGNGVYVLDLQTL